MILSTLEDAHRYGALHPGIAAALGYLRRFDPATPPGRHPVDGERCFALVERYETGPAAGKRFESHRRHLDVQFVAAGAERILHAPTGTLPEDEPYDAERDVVFYRDPDASSSLLLRSGDLAILHPEDAHKPGCMAGGRHSVLKVVVKVLL